MKDTLDFYGTLKEIKATVKNERTKINGQTIKKLNDGIRVRLTIEGLMEIIPLLTFAVTVQRLPGDYEIWTVAKHQSEG